MFVQCFNYNKNFLPIRLMMKNDDQTSFQVETSFCEFGGNFLLDLNREKKLKYQKK
jgi:hypothetical protein